MNTRIRVLVLEDTPSDAKLMLAEIRKAGFDPEWHRVDTEEDYLIQLEAVPDLILSDYSLPQFNALRALQILRERKLDFPFIIVSGTIGEDVAVQAMHEGAADYLHKDRLARLGQAVQRALELKALRLKDLAAKAQLSLQVSALAASACGILITESCRPDNPIIYVNPAFERITGYRLEEVLGRNCRFLQGKDSDTAAISHMREAILAARECSVEILNYRKDGTPFWNSLSITPVLNEQGTADYFVGVNADVSEKRNLENQLRQAQKMDALGQLAGGVAHDFNNLLTVISGYSEYLLAVLSPTDPKQEAIQAINDAGARAASLTRQLLAFSRQSVMEPSVLDLNDVVGDAGKMLRRLIGEDVQLSTLLEPKLGKVKADPDQLTQVLVNLVVNARDALPQGGQITIQTCNAEWGAANSAAHPGCIPGEYVMVAVNDSGCGMSAEVKARIFEPFFTTKHVGKGTGLGLSMVFGIVKQSGGFIDVFSEPGLGTNFKIYLPKVGEQLAIHQQLANLKVTGGTETILLVEDEAGVRGLANLLLQSYGYTVLEASNGKQALQVVEAQPCHVDLLLTDVIMPEMDGRELSEVLRARFPHMKVLFSSGYTDDAVVRGGILHEKVYFLQKPYTLHALASKVRAVLDKAT